MATSIDVTVHELVEAVQRLSVARSLEEVLRLVTRFARRLVDADGATFVLREGDSCFYADEDAIAPLWKGQRFPLDSCVSGWTILKREPVALADLSVDERIPQERYRATFVTSLVMVPIGIADPVGAIGMYWADSHDATDLEIAVARALADSTAVALEHIHALDEVKRTLHLSETDDLTGLPNRRAWKRAVDRLLDAPPASACVGFMDLDGFKAHNDRYGHRAGDSLLERVGEAWRASLRSDDILARYGGDEFALLIPHSDLEAGRQVAERLRRTVPAGSTVSIGLTLWEGVESVESTMSRADAALYEAKREGGDRVVLAAPGVDRIAS